MNRKIISALTAAAVFLAIDVAAQDNDGGASFAYATYFICDPAGESRADEIINSSFKPHYDAAVEQGDIQSWSWLQHYVGGEWRRVLVLIAPDMESILDASGALGEIISDRTPEAGRAFSGICSSHVDYIWQTVPGIGSGAASDTRGDAGFTVYMKCEMNREDRADQLMRDVIGPVFNRHVGDGKLISWNWLRQYVGGKWRRILVMGAADHKTLMATRAAIHEDFSERRVQRAVDEVNEICGEHQDYMWDILEQTP